MDMETQPLTVGGSGRCAVIDLGLTELPHAETIMNSAGRMVEARTVPDLLFYLAHPRTVAVGLKDRVVARPKDLLVSPERLGEEGIALVRSVRGGGITYHWPGQVVCYPVMLLRPAERNISAFMNRLEEVGIWTLKQVGISATRRRDSAAHIGLWVEGRKIVSMGIRVSRWVTSFGFAVNLEGDFSPSRYIRPCGIDGVRLTSIEEIMGHAPPRNRIIETIGKSFSAAFERTLEPASDDVLSLLAREAMKAQA